MQKGGGGRRVSSPSGGLWDRPPQIPSDHRATLGRPVSWARAWRARRGSEHGSHNPPPVPPFAPSPLSSRARQALKLQTVFGPHPLLGLVSGPPRGLHRPCGSGLGFSISTPQLRTLLYVSHPLWLGRETGPKSQSARGLPPPQAPAPALPPHPPPGGCQVDIHPGLQCPSRPPH